MYINIPNILKKGERLSVEFKKAKNKLPENLFDTVCAFLNRNGGTVLLGVTDNGIIEGVDVDAVQQMKKDIINLSNNPQKLFPAFLFDVQEVEFEGKWLIPKDIFIAQVPLGDIFEENKNEDFTKDFTKEILLIIKNKPTITTMELAENLKVTRRTIANYINVLKRENRIHRVDGKKLGYWKVIEEDK